MTIDRAIGLTEQSMAKANRVRRKEGDVVAIRPGDGTYRYGRVLEAPLFAFCCLRTAEIISVEAVLTYPIGFAVCVMRYALGSKSKQTIIGSAALTGDLLEERLLSRRTRSPAS